MTTLTIDLPDNLAEEAKQAGLLTPNAIESIMMKEIQEEVNAVVRAQRKQ